MFFKQLIVKGELELDIKFKKKNVIIGQNKTGKTTMMKLILFSLGVKVNDFITEILNEKKCSQVELVLELKDSKVYKFIRKLPYSETILVIPYKNENEYDEENLTVYTLEEFSDFLLEKEGYSPKVLTYGNKTASLRFYFFLRACFVDQETSAYRIFSDFGGKDYDYINSQDSIKKSIIEEILKKDNTEIYDKKIQLKNNLDRRREKNIYLSFLKNQIENLKVKLDYIADAKIEDRIEKITIEKKDLLEFKKEKILKLKEREDKVKEKVFIELNQERKLIKQVIRNLQLKIVDLSNTTKKIEMEILDLKKSIAARQLITKIPVTVCPICFSKYNHKHTGSSCPICNTEKNLTDIEDVTNFLKLLMDSQKESDILKYNIEKSIIFNQEKLKTINQKIDKIKKEELGYLGEFKIPINEIIEGIIDVIDKLTSEEKNLISLKEVNDDFKINKNEKDIIDNKVKELREEIDELENFKYIKDKKLINKLETMYSKILKFIYDDIGESSLDENLLPKVDSQEIRQASSASLKVAARLSFVLALSFLKWNGGNHIGVVYFDSPKDKDIDNDKYGKFIKILEKLNGEQIFISSSIEEKYFFEKIISQEETMCIELKKGDKLLKKNKREEV